MYVDDNSQTYPVIRGWGAVGGQPGNYTLNAGIAYSFGVAVAYTNRPLNKYVPAVLTWRCPADAGDANYQAKNCFTGYGNSYVTQHVTADSDPAVAAGAVPITAQTVAVSPVNKIIQGDWEWENNQYDVNNPESWWHNDKGQRKQNILFADGHVVFYLFPNQIINWSSSPLPNAHYLWW